MNSHNENYDQLTPITVKSCPNNLKLKKKMKALQVDTFPRNVWNFPWLIMCDCRPSSSAIRGGGILALLSGTFMSFTPVQLTPLSLFCALFSSHYTVGPQTNQSGKCTSQCSLNLIQPSWALKYMTWNALVPFKLLSREIPLFLWTCCFVM